MTLYQYFIREYAVLGAHFYTTFVHKNILYAQFHRFGITYRVCIDESFQFQLTAKYKIDPRIQFEIASILKEFAEMLLEFTNG